MLENNDNNEQTSAPLDNETIVKLLAIGIILLVMLGYIIFSGNGSGARTIEKTVISIDKLTELSNYIQNNYTMKVKEEINGIIHHVTNKTDGTISLYEGNLLDTDGILKYQNKYFYVVPETKELKPYNGDVSFASNLYYDYDFIKNLIPICKLEYVDSDTVKCSISSSDYFFEYNKIKETGINEADGNLVMMIDYDSDKITNIEIDYNDINKALNSNDDTVKYSIEISNVSTNDNSAILEAYKNILQK